MTYQQLCKAAIEQDYIGGKEEGRLVILKAVEVINDQKSDTEWLAIIHEKWCESHALPHMSPQDLLIQCVDLLSEDLIDNLHDHVIMQEHARLTSMFITAAKGYGVLS